MQSLEKRRLLLCAIQRNKIKSPTLNIWRSEEQVPVVQEGRAA